MVTSTFGHDKDKFWRSHLQQGAQVQEWSGAVWCPWFSASLSISAIVTGLQSIGDRSEGGVISSSICCGFGFQSSGLREWLSGSYDSIGQRLYVFFPLMVCLLMMYVLELDFVLNYVNLIKKKRVIRLLII